MGPKTGKRLTGTKGTDAVAVVNYSFSKQDAERVVGDISTSWRQFVDSAEDGAAKSLKKWWAGTGLNRRHQGFQSDPAPDPGGP